MEVTVRAFTAWGERHQVTLYLASIAVGAVVGLLSPSTAPVWESAVTPLLGVLLFATFLGVPFAHIGRAFVDGRFLGTLLLLNFVVVPALAFGVSRVVAADEAILLGVLLVLLTPCVDYVIVFTGLAGGDRSRLLAATPLLMLLQMLLLPVYLSLFLGTDAMSVVDPRPFIDAFLLLIALPLALAALTQVLTRRFASARVIERGSVTAMVPLMMLTLAAVVASQVFAVGGAWGRLFLTVPVFAVFAVIAAPLGAVLARVAGLDTPGRRAVVFSGVTRNSLVVLPLALALPDAFTLTPLVVVTQTMVELIVMVAMVAVIPRLIRQR
ncbi:arsenic resistance protein [Microbacterium sp. UBA3486]|uniref:arsenic resistance protein n=1 Tax=Microbacterium TaxID=33882 RepID=UPI0025DEC8F3|nr:MULTISPECIES: arsenic resistance protein [Microbacterium]